MSSPVAVVGAGVSGLTCAVLLAERGFQTAIFAEETGMQTTSAAAGAIWFPSDVEPLEAAIKWALQSYQTFEELRQEPKTGVSMIELRTFCRSGTIPIPDWAAQFGATALDVSKSNPTFANGFTMRVPLIDPTIYLDYLTNRFVAAGGIITRNVHFKTLEDVSSEFEVVVNCAGIGAQQLVPDADLEPHRGQVVIAPKLDLNCAVVCDDAPLMYVIPRTNDCVFGGTNDVSDDRRPDPATTNAIVDECSRVLNMARPPVVAERVGLRPFRRSGIRLERDQLGDGRAVVHNYGHGGAGFTLSWGCAQEVLRLVKNGT